MTIDELKIKCLEGIKKEKQLEDAQGLARNRPMATYHCGRKEVWISVHADLVRFF